MNAYDAVLFQAEYVHVVKPTPVKKWFLAVKIGEPVPLEAMGCGSSSRALDY